MRKILIATSLLFTSFYSIGQALQWSNWTNMSCFQGFQTSANNRGLETVYKDSYIWKMKVKNNYPKRVHFNMFWIVGNEKKSIGRFSLNPNEETNHVPFYFKSNSTNWSVEVSEVCFGENWMSCTGNCFAECDVTRGVPNQKTEEQCNSTKQNSSNTSSNNSSGNYNNLNDEIRDLQKRQAIACGKLQQQGQPFNSRLCTEGFNGALPQNEADTKKWVIQLRSHVKELESMTGSNITMLPNNLNKSASQQNTSDAYNNGVQKEYTGTAGFNFDFKSLFKFLTDAVQLDEIKQPFLNSGFKICENCFQTSDNADLSKNNEVLSITLKKYSKNDISISLSSPNICPDIQNAITNWIKLSDLDFFKSTEYGTRYIYDNKFILSVIPSNNHKQWEFKLAASWDINEFNKLKNNTNLQTTEKELTGVERDAEFKGDWLAFVSSNLDPINMFIKKKPDGRYSAVVKFQINKDGTITQAEYVSGDTDLAEEAIRVIKKSSGSWIPAQKNGKAVIDLRTQPVTMSISND